MSYELLRVIWWVLLGVLLIGFAILDGFDLGVAMWLPWLAKTDVDRRVIINSIAPTWEGNQVWFILGGGAIFAAWPDLYAVSFSGFYLAMLMILLALIIRPVGFKYRSKVTEPRWRSFWDYALFTSGLIPALIFGVAVGNVLQGVPFHFDANLRSFYTGNFWNLLNPFALLTGLLSVVMLAMHGAYFLNIKTVDYLQKRAIFVARIASILTVILFIFAGICVKYCIDGYITTTAILHHGPSNPLYKMVIHDHGAWLMNYQNYPLTLLMPLMGIILPLFAVMLIKYPKTAFVCSSLSLCGIIATVGVSMFPFILPSSSVPNHSLLIWDSSSSALTLLIMLIATVIFLPIVLLYTSWVYKVLSGKVTDKTIVDNTSY